MTIKEKPYVVFGYGSLIWKVRTTASLGTLGIARG